MSMLEIVILWDNVRGLKLRLSIPYLWIMPLKIFHKNME